MTVLSEKKMVRYSVLQQINFTVNSAYCDYEQKGVFYTLSELANWLESITIDRNYIGAPLQRLLINALRHYRAEDTTFFVPGTDFELVLTAEVMIAR